MRDVDAMVHTYTAMALGRGRMASPALGHPLHPGKSSSIHFIGGWVDPRTRLDMKEWRKIFTPSDIRDRTRAVQPIAKWLAAWAIWPIYNEDTFTFLVLFLHFRRKRRLIKWASVCVCLCVCVYVCVSVYSFGPPRQFPYQLCDWYEILATYSIIPELSNAFNPVS